MRGLYGSMLNIVYLMCNRMLVLTLAVAAVAIAAYVVGNIAPARNLSQLAVLVFIPLMTVWTARSSYNSKWNIFEQNWPTSPTVTIISRYILFAAINLVVSILWYLSPLYDGSFTNLVHIMGSAYLTLAIFYPIMYLLRSEKGDADQSIFLIAIMGSFFGSGWVGNQFGMTPQVMLYVVAYLVSLVLSIGFCRLHRGRAG